ncbi:hypothetical protein ACFOYW_00405 [Gryllotalpicola reticulitermitis]|uniref:Uncharacterized protein n=1 Tax=Gryllotalpicola reticulitermitis TaxID=1184153 RepID=A0ABV8Q1I4_9MICO
MRIAIVRLRVTWKVSAIVPVRYSVVDCIAASTMKITSPKPFTPFAVVSGVTLIPSCVPEIVVAMASSTAQAATAA